MRALSGVGKPATIMPQRRGSTSRAQCSLDPTQEGDWQIEPRTASTYTGYAQDGETAAAGVQAESPSVGLSDYERVSMSVTAEQPRRAWTPARVQQNPRDVLQLRTSSMTAATRGLAARHRSFMASPPFDPTVFASLAPPPAYAPSNGGRGALVAAVTAGGGLSGASGAGVAGGTARRLSCLASPTTENGNLRPYHNLHQLAGFDTIAHAGCVRISGTHKEVERSAGSYAGFVRYRSTTFNEGTEGREGKGRGAGGEEDGGGGGDGVACPPREAPIHAGALAALARRTQSMISISPILDMDHHGTSRLVVLPVEAADAPATLPDLGSPPITTLASGFRSLKALMSPSGRGAAAAGDSCNDNAIAACTLADRVTGSSAMTSRQVGRAGFISGISGDCSMPSGGLGSGGGGGSFGGTTGMPPAYGRSPHAPSTTAAASPVVGSLPQVKFRPFTHLASVPTRSFHLATAFLFVACMSAFAPAALLPVIQADLELSKSSVGGAAVAALAASSLVHLLMAAWMRRIGPRYCQLLSLLLTAPALACVALVVDGTGFVIVRMIAGVSLWAFIVSQFWMVATFPPPALVGAIATCATWGIAGGGVGMIVMPLLYQGLQHWYTSATAWRSSFYLPAAAHVVLALTTFLFGQDTAEGDFLDRSKLPNVYDSRAGSFTASDNAHDARLVRGYGSRGASLEVRWQQPPSPTSPRSPQKPKSRQPLLQPRQQQQQARATATETASALAASTSDPELAVLDMVAVVPEDVDGISGERDSIPAGAGADAHRSSQQQQQQQQQRDQQQQQQQQWRGGHRSSAPQMTCERRSPALRIPSPQPSGKQHGRGFSNTGVTPSEPSPAAALGSPLVHMSMSPVHVGTPPRPGLELATLAEGEGEAVDGGSEGAPPGVGSEGGLSSGARGSGAVVSAEWCGAPTNVRHQAHLLAVHDAFDIYAAVLMNPQALLLAASYGCSFGAQLVAFNTLPIYLATQFSLGPVQAGAIACMFGLLNVAARPLGGWLSDKISGRFGHGMRGRLLVLWATQAVAGLLCALLGGVAQRSLPGTVLLVGLFAVTSQQVSGMVFTIAPLATTQFYPAVMEVVCGGGLLGAVVLQAAFFSHAGLSYASGWLWMGVTIAAVSVCSLLLAAGCCCCCCCCDTNYGEGDKEPDECHDV